MELVLLTALGVGCATVVGAIIGFIFKKFSHKFFDLTISFAAGVMLAAAMLGLILPSVEYGGKYGLVYAITGIFSGAFFLNIIDKVVPHIHKLIESDNQNKDLDKVILFVMAIAIHNFPEGLAAGVGFGSDNIGDAIMIAGGIALQNIPEGMVIIGPLLAAGASRRKTFLLAVITGIVEVIGTLIGYFAVTVSQAVLPFALAFAGGTMLYIINDEMIPESHAHGNERGATYSLLAGFSIMLISDVLLG